MASGLFRTKSLDAILATADHQETTLRRSLGALHVTLLGIGATIGAGIFATIGTAAAGDAQRLGAGPSLPLSFVVTAAVCALTALCYAEFASMVPISGSAYTYAYSTLGELIAWIIGWDLILEYAIGNVAVAISWGNYFRSLLESFGIYLPLWLCTDYRTATKIAAESPEVFAEKFAGAPVIFGHTISINILAFIIVMSLTVVLVWGIRESARFNAVMVAIKVLVLAFFVAVALYFVSPGQMAENWTPFQPNGWTGTLTGAAIVFFAYIGFDAVSTVAEETRNPSRDLPAGIIGSLVVCTVIYVLVSAVFTGIFPYDELRSRLATEQAEPLTMAIQHVAPQARWATAIVAFGSVVAHTAVLLVFQMGQPRIFFSMARDGLLPPSFARVHPKFRTPHVTTIVTGLIVGILSSFASIDEMVDLTNIGTLFAFTLVCIGIPILRMRDPERRRPFRVPGGPFVIPVLGAVACLGLIFYLPPASWWRFVGWLTLGLAIYTAYGHARSRLSPTGPGKASVALRVTGIGLVLMAAAMILLPHEMSFTELRNASAQRGDQFHWQAFCGMYGIAGGLAVVILGLLAHVATGSSRAAKN